MKIIGLIVAWANKLFIRPSIEQALEYCDEVLVCVAPHSKEMIQYEDGTLDYALKYKDRVKFVEYNFVSNHATAKADILNKMIHFSDNFEVGNWLWILDVDEFYHKSSLDYLRYWMNSCRYTHLVVEEKYFMVNMRYYLTGDHFRFFKITSKNDQFIPTQNWITKDSKNVGILDRKFGMYHYGMLSDPHAKLNFWKTEYPNKEQYNKIEWLENVYLKVSVNKQEEWRALNKKITGYDGFWITDNFKPDKNNMLYEYKDKHPMFIEKYNLPEIEDYRLLYGK